MLTIHFQRVDCVLLSVPFINYLSYDFQWVHLHDMCVGLRGFQVFIAPLPWGYHTILCCFWQYFQFNWPSIIHFRVFVHHSNFSSILFVFVPIFKEKAEYVFLMWSFQSVNFRHPNYSHSKIWKIFSKKNSLFFCKRWGFKLLIWLNLD